MAEYIERNSLEKDLNARLRAISQESGMGYYDSYTEGFDECVTRVEDFPSADVVEVVRCKDCKHFRRNLENDTYCGTVGGLSDPEEHDFCSYGERKEGADNG